MVNCEKKIAVKMMEWLWATKWNQMSIVCIGISSPIKDTTTFFSQSPFLNLQNVQAPLFRQPPTNILIFRDPPLKIGFSVNPNHVKIFHP